MGNFLQSASVTRLRLDMNIDPKPLNGRCRLNGSADYLFTDGIVRR